VFWRSAEYRPVCDALEHRALARLDGLACDKARHEAKDMRLPAGAEVPSPVELTQVVERCATRR
jgi:hypothetical protein